MSQFRIRSYISRAIRQQPPSIKTIWIGTFNITFRYTDDAPLLNKFDDYLDRSHTIELVIKDMTNISRYPSYLYVHLDIDNECLLRMKLSDQRQQPPSIKTIWIGTTSYGITLQLRYCDIYNPYVGTTGMLLHINKQLTLGDLISSLWSDSFILNRHSLSNICLL
jgi:hypothetical protein